MDQHFNRRVFLKNSAFGFGGLLLIGPDEKNFKAQLTDWQGVNKQKLVANTWTRILREESGARRFSSFRYAPDIDRFLLWGFHGFLTDNYGNPEEPWTGNKEYDMVAFNQDAGRWENHLPKDKEEAWNKNPPPMHLTHHYMGITPGYYHSQLKEREGVLRPDLNIVSDQVTYDSKRRRMVYFTGGRTLAYLVDERKWLAIEGEVSPPPVIFGSLCYDPFKDRIILSGGGHVAEPGADGRPVGYTGTWIYDCASAEWSPSKKSGNPPPRMCSRMVCDTRNKVMVVFGGDAQTHYLHDTWILDLENDTWRKSSKTGSPGARAGHFTVYDPSTGLVVIGGGYNREALTDMWGYDVAKDSWSKLKGLVPVGWYITADIIPDKGTIVLTTSTKPEDDTHGCNEIYSVRTTWAFQIKKKGLVDESADVSAKQEVPKRSPEETTAGTQPDPARHRKQMELIENMPANKWIHFNDPGRVASVRTWGSCSFDTDKGRIIYWGGGHCGYGGNDYDFYDVEQNTWISSTDQPEFPERAWDKGVNAGGVTFSGGPWIRHGRKVYAYDPVSKKVINTKTIYLTAGYEPAPLKDIEPRNVTFGDKENRSPSSYNKWVTWGFDEKRQQWEILCSGLVGLDLLVTTPHGVMGIDHNWGAVDDENRPDIVTWNGQRMVDNDVYLLDVAGRKWKKLTQDGPWPQNLYEMTALVYDSKRDQLLLHGGGEKRDELWRFRLDKGLWEKIEPLHAEGTNGRHPTCSREAVYLPNDDVLLTSGRVAGDQGTALWAYKIAENRWYRLEIDPPEGRTSRDMTSQNRSWAYDPIHDVVLMVLGKSGDSSSSVVYGIRINLEK